MVWNTCTETISCHPPCRCASIAPLCQWSDEDVGGWRTTAFAKALVEVTGQTECFNDAGQEIDCAGTGQDGDIQAGVPFPKKRFTDKGNGTVVDKLTGLIWLKNANCFGPRTWAQALADANTLASGSCDLTDGSEAGDWRLPNIKELQSLIDFGNFNPALPTGHPFSSVQSAYSSSTTVASSSGLAWTVELFNGGTGNFPKGSSVFVWPVRGGR